MDKIIIETELQFWRRKALERAQSITELSKEIIYLQDRIEELEDELDQAAD
jgi:hypothetical protein